MINSGFMCPNCGPMKECSSKSIKNVTHLVCKRCEALVNKWERPLNERAGRCTNCAGCDFESSMGKDKLKGHLIRLCRICSEEYDIDTEMVLTPGKEEFKWKKQS